jgi:hypothetical protein
VKNENENDLDSASILFAFAGVLAIQAFAWGLGALVAAWQ